MAITTLDRRQLLLRGAALIAAAVAAGHPVRLSAEDLADLEVASAGSMRWMLGGPLKTSVATALHLGLHTHAQGADAVAKLIVSGQLRADVFIPITASPMLTVMHAGKADAARPIARTELVLVYSPKSRFAARFAAAANGRANWWEILQEPGLRIGRGDPTGDPGARAIIFAMMLAAKKYHQPDLVRRTLGAALNPQQIIPGVQARLHSGELDASTSYKTGVASSQLPYVTLPADINLSRLDVQAKHPDISLLIGGKTYYPEPLVFYAAALEGGANPRGAAAFLQWLAGPQAQALFHQHQFVRPGAAATLRA
ncbi:MAG TPA: substrate-binding domain-containing protein [Steroidobacteraceae bacterium]|nr:substrate-binding domain-containing protein [Steroidobacteraceae bacterium]